MRLFEAIIAANHRAAAGEAGVGLHPTDFPESLPLIALTCIDPRLNSLLPDALGIREEDFIWLRNAGNIIFDPMSSMTRTLALAAAIKGGREIAIIGHTDCRVRNTSMVELLERFAALGIDRKNLPDNLNEFFGLFASERQNVIRGAEIIRHSPLIGPRIPVHGLLIDIETGKLEWLVNGYQILATGSGAPTTPTSHSAAHRMGELLDFPLNPIKLHDLKIGETMPGKVEPRVEPAGTDEKTIAPAPPVLPGKSLRDRRRR